MASAKADLAFIKDFQQKVADFLKTFLQIEDEFELTRERGVHKSMLSSARAEYPEGQELIIRYQSQREAITTMYDRAKRISEKYGIVQQFHLLLLMQPGEADICNIDDRVLRDFHDSLIRLITAIENTGRFAETRRVLTNVWKWVDQRGIAKWIVVALIVLPALAILKKLGYDLQGLTQLVKAFWGK
jgi:hypothetical protein